jgi:hypothetical protein
MSVAERIEYGRNPANFSPPRRLLSGIVHTGEDHNTPLQLPQPSGPDRMGHSSPSQTQVRPSPLSSPPPTIPIASALETAQQHSDFAAANHQPGDGRDSSTKRKRHDATSTLSSREADQGSAG